MHAQIAGKVLNRPSIFSLHSRESILLGSWTVAMAQRSYTCVHHDMPTRGAASC